MTASAPLAILHGYPCYVPPNAPLPSLIALMVAIALGRAASMTVASEPVQVKQAEADTRVMLARYMAATGKPAP